MHPNAAVVQRLQQAFVARDVATLFQLVSGDLTLYVPGRSVFAGVHRGGEQILKVFYDSGRMAGRSFRLEVRGLVGGDDHVVAMHHITGRRDGKVLDQDSYLVCHVRGGLLTDVWVVLADLRQFDDFWS